jgi:16S rRNA G966 N2-methylase RsmD
MSRKILLDKLFPSFTDINFNKLLIDSDSINYITTPYNSIIIANIIEQYAKKYNDPKKMSIVDCTSGVGGDTITFCTKFGKIYGIEINEKRYNYLENNLIQYQFSNVYITNNDFLEVVPTLENIDIIFMDLPWGGRNYKNQTNLRISIGNKSMEDIVLNFFDISLMKSNIKFIVLKIPKNYDIKYLYNYLKNNCIVTLYDILKKINIIIIEKIINK